MSQASTNRSIDEEIELITSARTTSHLSFPVARGCIQLFNYYFREKDSYGKTRRLNAAEKDKRWKAYKRKVYTDYRRIVRGKWESEAALIKRYSDPMSFLKYRLKRHVNLRVSDLARHDQEYYKELGGIDNIEEMKKRQGNIDSIEKTANRAFKRRRVDEEGNFDPNHNHDYNRNHNHHNPAPPTSSIPTTPIINGIHQVNLPSPLQPAPSQAPKFEQPTVDAALNQLNQELNDIEQEQMQKKRALAKVLALEKTTSCIQAYQTQLANKPELLGIFPTASMQDQLVAGFELWLSENKQKIFSKIETVNIFIEQLCSLRAATSDWVQFLRRWKLIRIFHEDDFNQVWKFVSEELNIPEIRPEEDDEKKEVDE